MLRRHLLLWWLVFAGGAVLRLALFSGYGLGDDAGFFPRYHALLMAESFNPLAGSFNPVHAYDFRFGLWVGVAGSMHLFGVNEPAFIGFVTLCSLVNLGLVYLLARQEWDRRSGLLAMALLAVFPLDVLCSTLFVIDIPLATYCFGAFWLYREALARRSLVWAGAAAATLLVAYSTKQWAVLVGLIFLLEALPDVRRTWRISLASGGGFLVFVAAYHGWQWFSFGDPLYSFDLERSVASFAPHSREILVDYPRMLFRANEYGSYFAGFYPHALGMLAAVLALRVLRVGKWLLYTGVLLAALAAMPAQRVDGQWVVVVPHIFRYLCLLSIPLCLALTAYARELVRPAPRWDPALGGTLIAGFIALSIAQSIELTAPTRDAFGEGRRACRFLRGFRDDRIVSDWDFANRYQNLELARTRYDLTRGLVAQTLEARATDFRSVSEEVVVTGGARLPWYGCQRCTADLGNLPVPRGWRLLTTFEDRPLTQYRHEPLRIWRVSLAAEKARELLDGLPDLERREALLRDLSTRGENAVAAAVGIRMLEDSPGLPAVSLLTGKACAALGKLGCVRRHLAHALADGLEAHQAREALMVLVRAAARNGDFDAARRWIGEVRRRFPNATADPEFEDIESGMAEGFFSYHAGRFSKARRIYARLAEDDRDPGRRQRARYFLALSLFRQREIREAVEVTDAYLRSYGEDPFWVELYFREGEALVTRDPARTREVFDEIMARFPGTLWASEARRLHLPSLAPAP
jgi:4-amino-4-deoxy-L-arabinose transferase-like glycosyltransferase/tetratricopeptide (TPR) repeat protein